MIRLDIVGAWPNNFFGRRKRRALVISVSIAIFFILGKLKVTTLYRNSPPAEGTRMDNKVRGYEDIPTASYIINTSACKIPDLDPWHDSIRLIREKCDEEEQMPNCREETADKQWMYSKDSDLLINYTAILADGYSWNSIRCCYRVIERVEQTLEKYDLNADSVVKLSRTCHRLTVKVNHVPHEFIKAFCMSTSTPLLEDVVYRGYFAFARLDGQAQRKVSRWRNVPFEERPPNVILLGIDTNSRMNSLRRFSKTLKILRRLGSVEMLGYTKVGENTFHNTVPFLVGISDEEMVPLCFTTWEDAQDDCPYIWKEFDRAGYLTATVDDAPTLTSFNFQKAGFVFKPTDFYYRPFTLGYMMPLPVATWHAKCIGQRRNDEVVLDYIGDILKTTSDKAPVFIHSWFTTFTHKCIDNAESLDGPIADFLHNSVEPLTNAVFIFMSDHGLRYGSFRETTLGWYEDKLPSMWIYMTPNLRERFPEWHEAIKFNSRRLSSPYDLYHTLAQIISAYNNKVNFNESYELLGKSVPQRIGVTLLEPIAENRTCKDAGVPKGYCACTKPEVVHLASAPSEEKETFDKIASSVISYLRDVLPRVCSKPVLKRVVAGQYLNEVVEGENSSQVLRTYVLSLYTEPGDFLFEATVKRTLTAHGEVQYNVGSLRDILRMNKISRKVDCVNSPDLQRYCYCE